MRKVALATLLAVLAAATLPQVSGAEESTAVDESMDPLMVGDHWTYEIVDEVTGTVKSTISQVVTDVTQTDVSVRTETLGSSGYGLIIYDRSWSLKDNSSWKYAPNDGTGIKLPLTVGASWKFKSDDTFAARGSSFKRSGTSKIAAQERITTRAGTFDTFKIETEVDSKNVADPSRSSHLQVVTWYAPSVDHWVKRTWKTSVRGHINENTAYELVEFGRR